MNFPVYLDNNSTTPIDPEVLEVMLPFLKNKFGNASSRTHKFGMEAKEAVEFARKKVSNLINAKPEEIFYTSGATESINLALKGIAESLPKDKNHFITSSIEHKAVLDTLKFLENFGIKVTYLNVNEYGLIDPDDIKKSFTPNTALVSIGVANNEVGTIQPISEIGEFCKDNDLIFHTDASQAVGKIPIDVNSLNIDLLSFSSHKIYGPKGIGALYIKKKNPKINITAQIHGGGQEKDLRSGTLNVPAIVGYGKACEICSLKLINEFQTQTIHRDRLIYCLANNLSYTYLNGHKTKRLPNNINLSFKNVDSTTLMSELKFLAFSSGSACSSDSSEPSHVLKAMGKKDSILKSSVRFGIGRFTTEEEIDFAIDEIINAVKKIRSVLE